MLFEQRLLLSGSERLEIHVEPACVPIGPEIIERLWRYDRAEAIALRVEPRAKLALRPEGADVRSREADVVPEARGRHQEMHDPVAVHGTVRHVEDHRRPGRRSGGTGGGLPEGQFDRR